jgi:hypothetical protein
VRNRFHAFFAFIKCNLYRYNKAAAAAANSLADRLYGLGFTMGRLKTAGVVVQLLNSVYPEL